MIHFMALSDLYNKLFLKKKSPNYPNFPRFGMSQETAPDDLKPQNMSSLLGANAVVNFGSGSKLL